MLSNALVLLGVALIILKSIGMIDISWWLVFMPFGVLLVLYGITLFTFWGIQKAIRKDANSLQDTLNKYKHLK